MLGPLYFSVELVHLLAQLSPNGVNRRCAEISRIAERAAEDIREGRFRHGLIRGAGGLGAFAEDRLVESRVFESQNQLILASGNFLFLQICQRIVPKQRSVSHGHSEEECGIIVDEQIVLAACGAENDVFGISIVLHPPLVNLVDEPPASGGGSLQHKVNISIPKAVGEKGGQSCSCPAVDANNKGKLDAVTFRDEDEVVFVPQGQQNPGQVARLEVVLRSTLIHHQAFVGQNLPHPLTNVSDLLPTSQPDMRCRGPILHCRLHFSLPRWCRSR